MELAKRAGYKLTEEELTAVSGGGAWTCTDLDDDEIKPWKMPDCMRKV